MPLSKERKDLIKKDISAFLEKHGQAGDFSTVYHKYETELPKSTFYRWVKLISESGVPAQNSMRKARKRTAKKAKAKKITDKKELAAVIAGEVVDALPLVPDAVDVTGVSITEMGRKLSMCMAELEGLIEHSKGKDGKVRNAMMLMRAVDGLRRTVDSTTRVMEMLWDIKRTEQFHQAIFNRLRERDPAFVEAVLGDLKRINAEWGIQL